MNFKTFERITTVIALIGAYLVSTNSDLSKYGFIFFLLSSFMFIYIGWRTKLESVWVVNVAFAVTNLNGLYNFWK